MLIPYLIVLRFVHIVSSVCWAGGGFISYLFIEPTAKSLAPTGMQFLQHMVGKGRFNVFMVVNSTLTVLSGALLLWQSTGGGQLSAYMQTGPGLGFTLGSLVGVVVYFVGMFGVGPRAGKLAKLGQAIQVAGGPPTPEQQAELQKLDKEMTFYHTIDFWLVALSLALMATARFWLF